MPGTGPGLVIRGKHDHKGNLVHYVIDRLVQGRVVACAGVGGKVQMMET